ncbi:MAG: dTDP-4-dehydrorhamnose 3,5-epimerase family protein, partial [Pseudobutyrivibrio sp.]|nr:dTDP-4-dehydrorhamnose 3,5-epimerase family protein [Pseudobutyrivibrio sp.]
DFYHPNDEGGLMFNDPDINVQWPIPEGMTEADLILSDKDKVNASFKDYCKEHNMTV